jgi:hypothetical protein
MSSEKDPTTGIVENADHEGYFAVLKDKSRPPSNGGNTTAMHRHRINVGGKWYSWLAAGSKKWVFVGDRVSFQYVVTPEGYRNVLVDTLRTVDKDGNPVIRGNRKRTAKRRTAQARLPGRRREWKD